MRTHAAALLSLGPWADYLAHAGSFMYLCCANGIAFIAEGPKTHRSPQNTKTV